MAISEKALPLVYSVTVLLALALVTVLLRIYVRVVRLRNPGWDDWLCLAAMCLSIVVYAANMTAVAMGFGAPFPSIGSEAQTRINQAMWISPPVWGLSTAVIKMSIVVSYTRIWSSRRFLTWSRALLGALAAFGLALFFGGVFACVPIRLSWSIAGNDATDGRCINQPLFMLITSAINIAFDLLVFAIPVPLTRRLQVPRPQRIALMVVFTVGAIACLASIMRLVAIRDLANATSDPSVAGLRLGIWSGVESNLGILCACLPSLRPMLARLFPRLLLTVKSPSWSSRRRTATMMAAPRRATYTYGMQPIPSCDGREDAGERGGDDDEEGPGPGVGSYGTWLDLVEASRSPDREGRDEAGDQETLCGRAPSRLSTSATLVPGSPAGQAPAPTLPPLPLPAIAPRYPVRRVALPDPGPVRQSRSPDVEYWIVMHGPVGVNMPVPR
ncbi:hypothetical protein F5Y15DRAFT_430018 [Xylariaceae sp. FL0016]|nr:hypothetical protein F5Y15DRAFT_430018 [Xylariaceae sp. FL0016]